jgi:hypothetical protein
VLSGSVGGGQFNATTRKIPIKAHNSTGFRFQGAVPHSTHESCVDGKIAKDEIYAPAYYLIRARHCKDLVLEVTKDWQPHEIELSCELRHE